MCNGNYNCYISWYIVRRNDIMNKKDILKILQDELYPDIDYRFVFDYANQEFYIREK